jgi:hypothetical protein
MPQTLMRAGMRARTQRLDGAMSDARSLGQNILELDQTAVRKRAA